MRGTITKRGKDSLYIVVSAGLDTTGKRLRLYSSVRRQPGQTAKEWRAAAEAELARMVHEHETGTGLDSNRSTVADLFARFVAHKSSRGDWRPSTLRRNRELVRLHITPVIGALRIGKVRPAHIDAVLDAMHAKGLSAKTLKHAHQVMGSAFRQARRWRLVTTNPVEDVSPPKIERSDLDVPSPDELVRLLEVAKGESKQAAVVVFVSTGLRRGEVIGLCWRDLDLDAGRLQVRQTLQRVPFGDDGTGLPQGTRLEFCEPKTDRSRRTVSLPPFAVDVLRRHRVTQNERRLILGEAWIDLDLVFPAWNGGPRDPDAFGRAVRRIMSKAGLDRSRLHDLRHGFATAMLSEGVHPAIASAVLGHASPGFTMSVYQHVLDGMTDTASAAIERALAGGKLASTAESERTP